ncbi:MAG TPA: phosphoribosylformylglycinamidine cyclo-ligase [Myxococcota bacterium]|nr:phosphoribosylformylglycinamidine cyclo-ligase [Myxococcota bacterium]
MNSTELSYADAGVDIDFAAGCLNEIDKTRSRERDVIKSHNDFAGLFSMGELCKKFAEPVLVSGTDGVGTKLLVAMACERYDGLGQDLVAMCANDIATKGAEPLFFLDYFATSNLRSVPFVMIVNGIVAACDEIDCALIGGETAEMPALYAPKHFDLAGFAVGVAERSRLLGSHRVREGDALIGLGSSGLHSNGFSLVRKIMFDKLRHRPNDVLWQTERRVMTVRDELLVPTKLYVNAIKSLLNQDTPLSAIAHITGGGITENVPRIIPPHLKADIDLSALTIPRIFTYLMENGPVSPNEALRTFNMGVGLVIAIPEAFKRQALDQLKESGEVALEIGKVVKCEGGHRCQVKLS